MDKYKVMYNRNITRCSSSLIIDTVILIIVIIIMKMINNNISVDFLPLVYNVYIIELFIEYKIHNKLLKDNA